MKKLIQIGLLAVLIVLPMMMGCQGEPTDEPVLPGGRLLGINLEPGNLILDPGRSVKFLATGIFPGGVTYDLTPFVTWVSSNPSVAYFLADGTLVGNFPGTTLINAKYAGTNSQTITVTVPGAPSPGDPTTPDVPILMSISVTPKFIAITEEEEYEFSCKGIFSDGSEQDYTNVVEWRISDPTLGFITSNGKFVSIGGGGVLAVSAKYGVWESNYAVLTIHTLL